ncbi:hypothetical protein FACS189499_00780 [Clostridia bacterium]|nr:hypothetical protein FACS189499_00780 [Clostridia bacterium]
MIVARAAGMYSGTESVRSLVYIISAVFAAAGIFLIILPGFLKKHGPAFAAVLLSAAVGAAYFTAVVSAAESPADMLDGETYEVTAVIVEKGEPDNDNCSYIVSFNSLDGTPLRASFFGADTDGRPGDTIRFTARFRKLSADADSAYFSESGYYFSRKVFLKATVTSRTELIPGRIPSAEYFLLNALYDYSGTLGDMITASFPGDTGGILRAMALGDKGGLSPSLSASLKRAGFSHYTSVSGMHLALIAQVFITFAGFFLTGNNRVRKLIIVAVIITLLMLFFRLTPSVMRAGFMLLCVQFGDFFFRRGNVLNSLGGAAGLIVLASPFTALDYGLILSVSATFGVGVLAPKVNFYLKHILEKRKIPGTRLVQLLTMGVCATVATLPFSGMFFGGAAVLSPFTSLILTPFFTIAVIALMIAAVLFPLGLALEGGALFVAGLSGKIMVQAAEIFGGLEYAYIPLGQAFFLPWVVAALIFVTAVYFLSGEKRISRTAQSCCLAIVTLAGMAAYDGFRVRDSFTAEIFSDGGAGAVFLKKGGNSAVIVTGASEKTALSAEGFLRENLLPETTALILMQNNRNAETAFGGIKCLTYFPPETVRETRGVYDVGGDFTITFPESKYPSAEISFGGRKMLIRSIKQETEAAENADITVIYGYKKVLPEVPSEMVVYLDRKAPPQNDNEYNAYFEKFRLRLE